MRRINDVIVSAIGRATANDRVYVKAIVTAVDSMIDLRDSPRYVHICLRPSEPDKVIEFTASACMMNIAG